MPPATEPMPEVLRIPVDWTLEGDAAEQLEALFKQEQEDKLSDPMADVLELCRERWKDFKRRTRRDVIEKCDGFKTKDGSKDRKALRTLRCHEGKGLLTSPTKPPRNVAPSSATARRSRNASMKLSAR